MKSIDIDHQQIAVSVNGVSKYFEPSKGQRSIKNAFSSVLSNKKKKEKEQSKGFWALKDLNFKIEKGEFFGILGRNGSGKSTLLKMIAGVYNSTKGSIAVEGRLVPFIELGVGFNPELSGRDNVFLNGSLLGFNRKEMTGMYDEIVDFAELNDHMDVKLKNFSSGMQVRLAFSIAIRAKADVLLIDEVLAVGDAAFQQKCFRYFEQLRREKRTVVFISHDMSAIRRFCTRAITIDSGVMVHEGSVIGAIKAYEKILGIGGQKDQQKQPTGGIPPNVNIEKNVVEILKVSLVDRSGSVVEQMEEDGFGVKIVLKALRQVKNPVPGVVIFNTKNERISASNSLWIGMNTGVFQKGEVKTITFWFENCLESGEYTIAANVVNDGMTTFYDWKNNAHRFICSRAFMTGGIMNPRYTIEVK